jgi:hypothetical protein
MICPHCDIEFQAPNSNKPFVIPKSDDGEISIISWGYCPNKKCNQLIIMLNDGKMEKPNSKDFKIENVSLIYDNEQTIYPLILPQPIAPMPTEGMPKDIREDYMEARAIVEASPRSALALLRLCTEKLAIHLEAEGKNLDKKIDSLAQRGYSKETIQALDLLRVVGNSAVHKPQEIITNSETAIILFKAFNFVVNETIVHINQINELFDSMPEDIKRRNMNRFNKKDEGE